MVSFDFEIWVNNDWGFHNIERTATSGTVAIFGDGSRANFLTFTKYKHYFFPTVSGEIHSIYWRQENLAYMVDDQARLVTILRCRCTWEIPQPPPPDAQCKAVALSYLGAAMYKGVGTIAGLSVITYRTAHDGDEHQASFAPQFDCDVLEEQSTSYNSIGIPTSHSHFIVRSYVPGEPRREFLQPPLGYSIQEKRQ